MFFIAGSWLGLFLLCVLAGTIPYHAYLRLVGRRYYCPIDLFRLAWLGYAFVIGILQPYSLFSRIDGWTFAVIGLLAVFSGLYSKRYLRKCWELTRGSLNRLNGVLFLVFLVAIVGTISLCSTFPPIHYDTELYHLNAVKWASSYPAIPGIVNLHGRLAFNSSFHLFAALTNFSVWGDRSIYLANGFILCLASVQWLYLLLARCKDNLLRGKYFISVTFPFLLTSAFTWSIPSLSTDLPFHVLGLVAIRELISMPVATAHRSNTLGWLIFTALSATVFSTKMTGAPFMLLVPVAAYLAASQRTASGRGGRLMPAVSVFILPGILALGLVLRHAVLSGWLLFPFPFGNLHMDWSATPKFVTAQMNWAKSWARFPGRHYQEVLNASFSYWFTPWLAAFKQNKLAVVLLATGIIGTVGSAVRMAAGRDKTAVDFSSAASILLSATGLAFWFVSAPDYRFGELYFWAFAATASAPLSDVLTSRSPRILPLFSLLLLAAVSFAKFKQGEIRYPPISHLFDRSVYGEPPSYRPQHEVVPVKVHSGQTPPLIIFRPAETDQCGNSPLPCSPYVTEESTIEQRTHGDISSGFRSTGEIPAGIQY